MTGPDEVTEAPSAVQKVRQLLNRRLKVTLHDNRVLYGDLQCLDKQGNLILSNTVEEHAAVGSAVSKPSERVMGTVLVPFTQQADVHMQVSPAEKASMLEFVGSSQ